MSEEKFVPVPGVDETQDIPFVAAMRVAGTLQAKVDKLEAEIETLNAQLSTEVEVLSCGNCADMEAENLRLREALEECTFEHGENCEAHWDLACNCHVITARAALGARESGEGGK